VRRFNTIIHFPIPNAAERYAIWKTTLPAKASLAEGLDLQALAHQYELSGSAIISVIHYASLQAIGRSSVCLSKKDIVEGIRREYEKEEKVFVG
jgi:ATP-dependent 26S proteasome regulatory subunit